MRSVGNVYEQALLPWLPGGKLLVHSRWHVKWVTNCRKMSRRRSGGRVFVVGVGMSKFHKPKKGAPSEGMAGGDDKGERIGGGRSIHTLLRKAL